MRSSLRSVLPLAFGLLSGTGATALADDVPFLDGEQWWGGPVVYGAELPVDATAQRGHTFHVSDRRGVSNQTQPLLISSQGRYIWNESAFDYAFDRGTLRLSGAATPFAIGTGGTNLRDAFRAASKRFFPASGRLPAAPMFRVPQYNTWIELTYDQREDRIRKYAHDLIAAGYPPGVIMIDDNWQEAYGVWEFSATRFRDPKGLIRELHDLGFKVMLWVCPYVSPDTTTYRELLRDGCLIRDVSDQSTSIWVNRSVVNDAAIIRWWNGASAALDLSNPKAVEWLRQRLQHLVDEYGVDGFKFDGGDSHRYVASAPGRQYATFAPFTAEQQTSAWARLGLDFAYNEYRACWQMAGQSLGQRLRDKDHTWEALRDLIPGMIASGLSGYAFTCPDMIGGGEFSAFENPAKFDPELVVRSAQVQALMPMMQFSVAPWRVLSPELAGYCLDAAKLHQRFGEELVTLARESATTGDPIIRPLEWQWPHQGYAAINDQFMIGDDLLVAPVLTKGARSRTVVLPPGRWRADDGSLLDGPAKIEVTAPLSRLPYFRRVPDFQTAWIEQVEFKHTEQDVSSPRRRNLAIAGRKFAHGFNTHANATTAYELGGDSVRLTAWVGIDDTREPGPGTVEFSLVTDGTTRWRSGIVRAGEPARPVDVDLTGVQHLVLTVTDAGDGSAGDSATWGDVRVAYRNHRPKDAPSFQEEPYILTPPAPPTPRLNGARVYGCRPGHDFLYAIAATGDRPMKFGATGLPAGLSLDPATGLITGKIAACGTYRVKIVATNAHGTAERELRLECGDTLALTPPMGWNSWNCFADAVTAQDIRNAADAMIASGLTQHGWSFINVDDFWERNPDRAGTDPTLGGPGRDASGNIVPNPRFPDMRALTDHLHALGLKFGIYSTPGPLTCGDCLGSFNRERQDALTYATWGVDYLKYDWCSYSPRLEARRETPPDFGPFAGALAQAADAKRQEQMRPYALMGAELARVDRDIIYSLCQYGMGNVWEWGASLGGNCWRTTGDITDTWASMSYIGFSQSDQARFAGPGHWNDPDIFVVGQVGWGAKLHQTRLTPSEQYTHITLWCLLNAPLLIGCDMTKLDAFTLNFLTNDEVIEVNQDPLGEAAHRITQNGTTEVWAKRMEDGSYAIGLFNRGRQPAEITIDWATLGLQGVHRTRDLWRQQDLGNLAERCTRLVRPHGAEMLRIW